MRMFFSKNNLCSAKFLRKGMRIQVDESVLIETVTAAQDYPNIRTLWLTCTVSIRSFDSVIDQKFKIKIIAKV